MLPLLHWQQFGAYDGSPPTRSGEHVLMNYYERHLGDWVKDTAHLSMMEHGAYNLLVDRYYGSEQPIPNEDRYRHGRAKTDEERAAVDFVLREFFRLDDDGMWRKGRIEEEI